MGSLWGEEFEIKETPKEVKKILQKVQNPKKVETSVDKILGSKKTSLTEKLAVITENVNKVLGVYKGKTVVIKTKQQLVEYIDKAIQNGIIAIDTETNNSLDPITCLLMGPCIYTPGMLNAYIPLNHVNPETNERLSWQLTEQDIKEQFDRLGDTKILTHNGAFDYQVIKCTTGYKMKIYWDTMIGARMLDENERSAGLKQQYISKIDPSIEKYSIDKLFEKIEYALVDPDIFALYAATDAYMTYKLYEWQRAVFEQADHNRLYKVFSEIEVPLIEVVAEMELAGVEIDQAYSARLSTKYHHESEEVEKKIRAELSKYDNVVKAWRETDEAKKRPIVTKGDVEREAKSKSEQLADPISLTSPTQLAILLYDVLKVPVVDPKTPRGTGEDILAKIDLPLCKLMLEKRGLDKLINVFIDKLPNCVNPKTHRLHAHFNQLGTDTGRFSSTDPNLQQIPSHNKEIRMMFKAADGHVLIGSDFSQQEPRLLSNYAQDESMINAYKQGKDLYATIAAGIYNNDYWDNMEHYEDGTPNPEGKKRRGFCKSILLGLMYGRGAASIAEQIGQTVEEAQKIIDMFYDSFPKVKDWVAKTRADAHANGYVEDLWGRRRRLPDIQLPKYEVTVMGVDNYSQAVNFNPLLGSRGKVVKQQNPLIAKYQELTEKCRGKKDFETLKEKAVKEGVTLKSNSWLIAQAERQCVNARVQGGAATMSKRALIHLHNDEELRSYKFQPLIVIHDEIIGECPEEFAQQAADRLAEVMKHAAEPECVVPFKCDAEITHSWYEGDYYNELQELVDKQRKAGLSDDEIIKQILMDHEEITEEDLKNHIKFS